MPIIKATITSKFHFFIAFKTINILAITRPKKKDQRGIGSFSSNQLTNFEKEMILMTIPKKSAIKKLPLI